VTQPTSETERLQGRVAELIEDSNAGMDDLCYQLRAMAERAERAEAALVAIITERNGKRDTGTEGGS